MIRLLLEESNTEWSGKKSVRKVDDSHKFLDNTSTFAKKIVTCRDTLDTAWSVLTAHQTAQQRFEKKKQAESCAAGSCAALASELESLAGVRNHAKG